MPQNGIGGYNLMWATRMRISKKNRKSIPLLVMKLHRRLSFVIVDSWRKKMSSWKREMN
jgi:hypothetical protein